HSDLDESATASVSKTDSIVLDIMRRMDRVRLAVCGVLAAGWLTVSAQVPVPQPFPGRPNPPKTVPPPPKTVPPPAGTPAPIEIKPAAPPEPVPTEATLGFPIYPNAQFLASYDAGRGQRYYLFGSELPFAALFQYSQN